MNRKWHALLALFVASALTGCDQAALTRSKAELARVNAELAKTQAELAKVKADAEADRAEREIDVQLPALVEAKPLSSTPDLVINVNQDGSCQVKGQETGEEQLQQLLLRARQKNSNQAVLIRANQSTELRHVVSVMSMCSRADIEDYRLATIEKE